MRVKDLTGNKFNRLVALKYLKKSKWLCKCDCGNEHTVNSWDLQSGHVKSCGCLNKEHQQNQYIDHTGKIFGKLTALRKSEKLSEHGNALWICKCICNNIVEVSADPLVRGLTQSCGCLRKNNPKKYKKYDFTGQIIGRLYVKNGINLGGPNKEVKWVCECSCGKTIIIKSEYLVEGTKSCGCLQKRTGPENPKWNHDLSLEDRENRKNRGKKFEVWAKQIKIRDNFTCKLCFDDSGGNLISHHLNAWHSFKNQRYDLNNGICLCESCHKQFHSIYGSGHNTKAQFKEFCNEKYGDIRTGEIFSFIQI